MYPSRKQSSTKNASKTMQQPWEETPSTGADNSCPTGKKEQSKPSLVQPISRYHHYVTNPSTIIGRKVFLRPHQMFVCSCNMESQDEGDGHGSAGELFAAKNSPLLVKKRFRTKFTQEQKEKLFVFAEQVGWKMHKQEEGVVQQFCREIGVKRRVLKVWMHNNKKNLAKKYNPMLDS